MEQPRAVIYGSKERKRKKSRRIRGNRKRKKGTPIVAETGPEADASLVNAVKIGIYRMGEVEIVAEIGSVTEIGIAAMIVVAGIEKLIATTTVTTIDHVPMIWVAVAIAVTIVLTIEVEAMIALTIVAVTIANKTGIRAALQNQSSGAGITNEKCIKIVVMVMVRISPLIVITVGAGSRIVI